MADSSLDKIRRPDDAAGGEGWFERDYPALAAKRLRSADACYEGQPDYRSSIEASKHPDRDGRVPK